MLKAAIVIPLFFTSCLCQFIADFAMKPDVTFGAQNDRFDVASIIQDQNRMLDINHAPDDYRRLRESYSKDMQDYRKIYDKNRLTVEELEKNAMNSRKNERKTNKNKDALDKGVVLLNAIKETVDTLGIHKNFATHDDTEDDSDAVAYEKNLAAFKRNPSPLKGKRRSLQEMVDQLHGGVKSGRRGSQPAPEHEILFHFGVPVIMKMEGFIQVPLEKNKTIEADNKLNSKV